MQAAHRQRRRWGTRYYREIPNTREISDLRVPHLFGTIHWPQSFYLCMMERSLLRNHIYPYLHLIYCHLSGGEDANSFINL